MQRESLPHRWKKSTSNRTRKARLCQRVCGFRQQEATFYHSLEPCQIDDVSGVCQWDWRMGACDTLRDEGEQELLTQSYPSWSLKSSKAFVTAWSHFDWRLCCGRVWQPTNGFSKGAHGVLKMSLQIYIFLTFYPENFSADNDFPIELEA